MWLRWVGYLVIYGVRFCLFVLLCFALVFYCLTCVLVWLFG